MVTTRSSHHSPSQVISPTRARASESEERPVSSAAEQQPDPASADETLVQAIATAVVRALSVVRTGPQQVVTNQSGNPPEEENRQLPSPRPQRNLDAELSASLTPYGTSLNAPFEPRSPSPSAYETGTRSSSDKTTKNDNMGTWQASHIQLASTKFDGMVENWSRWKTEMQAIFHWQGLLQLVQGREEFDQARADRRQEWKNCFETRERKAHTEIVLSLHGDLLDRFKSDIESARPAQLWTALLRTYDGTQGTNSVYLKQDMYARRLRQGEGVMDYINDLQRMRRELERMDVSLPEGEMASVVLSNAVNVFPSIANEHTQRVSRLRGGYDKDQRVQDAVNLLLVAERTAQEQKDRGNRNDGHGIQRQVNAVNHHQGGNRQQHGGKRHHSGSSGQGSSKKKRSEEEATKRRAEIQELKRTTECKSCHKRGHWWKECPDRKSTNREEIRTMAGSVLRRVEGSTRAEDSGRTVTQDDVVGRRHADLVETHPLRINPARQRKDAHSYSTIYTRHELSALIGRDFEERLLRARDAQREDESIEYSPTSPPDDADEDERGASGLPVVRRVLAATTNGGTGAVPADEIEWILDSGAQVNVTGELQLLNNVMELQHAEFLEGATGSCERIGIAGAVLMPVVNDLNGRVERRLLEEVRYSAGTKVNLISQTYMQFTCGSKLVMSDDQLITWLVKPNLKLKFVLRDGLYRMRVQRHHQLALGVQKRTDVPSGMELLHSRLNHVSMDTIKNMVFDNVDFGVKVNMNDNLYDCIPCVESKMKRMTYRRDPRRATKKLEKISADLCSISEIAVDKSTMFLLVMDEFSRFRWVFLLQSKADASRHLRHLMLKLEKQDKKYKILVFHADGGGEFVSNEFKKFCASQGVEMQFTHADSPEENAIVERANGVIVTRVRSMLEATRLPNLLWGEALLHAVDTLNVCPSSSLKGKSSYQAFYDRKPDLRSLRTWGCMAHVHISESSRQKKEKLSTRARTCILLGYATDRKGYKLLDVKSGSVITARKENIRFHESFTVEADYMERLLLDCFFGGDYELPANVPVVRIKAGMNTYTTAVAKDKPRVPITIVDEVSTSSIGPAAAPNMSNGKRKQGKRKRSEADRNLLVSDACLDEDWVPPSSAADARVERAPRPQRQRKPSVRLRDYVINSVIVHEDVVVPTTYKQARASPQWPQWKQAMLDELQSLRDHGTWTLEPRTAMKGRKAITCRWVYAVKRDEHGKIKRFKARLVIHGFKQLHGLEYTKTYAPVIRFETIRAAIYFALQRGWVILQYDVKTAFLYGHLDELIFMEQPPGFQREPDVFVCRLLRSLYGLRQAPNVWNRTLHEALQRLGFSRLDSDYGLYARKVGDTEEISMLMTVYVDDVLLLGPPALCGTIAQQLSHQFELTKLGPVKYLLGVEIMIDPVQQQVMYCQRQYVKDVLKRFSMAECNGCMTPEATSPQQVRTPSEQIYLPYRELVGALQYLVSASRPDIAHAVRNLGKYLGNYTYEHYFMAKRVLRYLAHTVNYGLVNDIDDGSEVRLTCFTDADYANDADDRKSVSGYVTMLDGNVVSYASRKQEINAQSTTEAEYVAMNEGTKDLLWMLGLCVELKWKVEGPVLFGDNRGSIFVSAKPGKHSKTKHIENKYHLVRHLVEEKRLKTEHVGTNDMVADILTKALGRVKFERCRQMLKVLPLPGH